MARGERLRPALLGHPLQDRSTPRRIRFLDVLCRHIIRDASRDETPCVASDFDSGERLCSKEFGQWIARSAGNSSP